MAKKTHRSFADPTGLKTIKLNALAQELAEQGEPAFRKKYPGPFLLVVYVPSTNPGLSEHTVWTRQGQRSSMNLPAPDKAIPLLEAQKPKKKITVGRADQNDIVIYASGISKTHAAFLPAPDGSFRLMDMGSANGTAVNGVELEESRPVKLTTGDRVSFWWFQFQFVALDALLKSLREQN